MQNDLAKILVTEAEIQSRVQELGNEISTYYTEKGIENITLICITNGAIIFAADLLRALKLRTRLDCVRASTYLHETSPIEEPEIIDHVRLNIQGSHVLMIDDILDTGRTSSMIISALKQKGPATIKTCMLLDKIGRREAPIEADFVGFKIPNEFVVGYGLDFGDFYRNLPCIGVLKSELQNPPQWQS